MQRLAGKRLKKEKRRAKKRLKVFSKREKEKKQTIDIQVSTKRENKPTRDRLWWNNYRKKSEEFLRSTEWKKLRYRVLRKYGFSCMACGARPPALIQVDHIKPRITHPQLALDFNNLQVLCATCNAGKGSKYEDDLRPQ